MSVGRLIGIMGVKRAGKDETARAIMELDPSFVRVAFADPMKRMALAMNPIIEVSWEQCNQLGLNTDYVGNDELRSRSFYRLADIIEAIGWDNAKDIPDVRVFLQRLGTEGGREVLGEDIWVDKSFEGEVIPALNAGSSVVVTDMRFPNEIRRVREAGGEVWRVDRPKLETDTSTTGKHSSEVEWRKTKPDEVILNDGDVDDLKQAVKLALA